jgi:hypothetical protein
VERRRKKQDEIVALAKETSEKTNLERWKSFGISWDEAMKHHNTSCSFMDPFTPIYADPLVVPKMYKIEEKQSLVSLSGSPDYYINLAGDYVCRQLLASIGHTVTTETKEQMRELLSKYYKENPTPEWKEYVLRAYYRGSEFFTLNGE